MTRNVILAAAAVAAMTAVAAERPVPRAQLLKRINADFEVMGIVHWGLNTYTDREWGFGNENPADLAPTDFDADQIVGACRDGGLQGLVVVAKHHDGFCLWPTKTTEHNITKAVNFRGGKGDYVREMEQACRKAGLRFGIYISPWDRNNAEYGRAAYVDNVYQAQVRELLGGAYGDVFEFWCDGANGGTGWYGGAAGEKGERRRIGRNYYRFDDLFAWVRSAQPDICVFHSEDDGSDLRYPGNESGRLDPDCRATSQLVGGHADGVYGNPNYPKQAGRGDVNGERFRMVEADLPLRPGWFYHAKECGRVKHAAYLLKLYLGTVGNGGILNLGIAPDRRGRLDDEDVRALKGFKALKDAFFAKEVTDGGPFNVVVLSEDVARGEQVDGWEFLADGKALLAGKSVGHKRIRVLDAPVSASACELKVTEAGPALGKTSFRRYFADPALVKLVQSATTASGETDTFKWMTGREKERR